jgi:hypothetical protein
VGFGKAWEAGQRLEKAILSLKTYLVIMGTKPKYCIEYGSLASFLILDGLTSQCSFLELLQIVKKKKMIIMILPSHTKAMLQPLDRENAGLCKMTCNNY